MSARLCALALLATGVACVIRPPVSPLMREVGRSHMSPNELRVRVRALAPRFSGLLESEADEIAARTTDPGVRLEMTRFKTNAIPIMQASLFQPDPVAALVDAWALLAQLQQALLRGKGLEDETLRQLALQRFRAMEQEVEALWRELTGSEEAVVDTRRLVHQWAEEHPVTGTVASRESTVGLLAHLTARTGVRPLGAAAELLEDLGDLSARLDLQTAFLPKQARWQAEFAVQQALADPTLQSLQQDLAEMLRAATQAMHAAQRLPALVTRETDAAFDRLHTERLGLQDFVEVERKATVEDLRGERAVVLEALKGERVAVLADVERMSTALVDRSFDRAAGLMDRFFLWLLLTVGLLLVGGILALWLVLRAWRRSTSARGEEP